MKLQSREGTNCTHSRLSLTRIIHIKTRHQIEAKYIWYANYIRLLLFGTNAMEIRHAAFMSTPQRALILTKACVCVRTHLKAHHFA
jgi:sugar (pentulose or hexulose) kinase